MSLSVQLQPLLIIDELISAIDATGADATIKHSLTNIAALIKQTYNGATTPPMSKCAVFQKAMSAGAATIDMTALVGTNGGAVDFSSLKPQILFFYNNSTHDITIVGGASNGNLIFGASGSRVLKAGQWDLGFANNAGVTVDSTHKTIDISGTTTDTLICALIAG